MLRPGAHYLLRLVAIGCVVGLQFSCAGVKQIVVTSRQPWLAGKSMGAAGVYEKVQGRVVYAINPNDAANLRIADIANAPRNAQGMVEFSGDFVVVRPVDPARARPSVFLEILNRGRTQASDIF